MSLTLLQRAARIPYNLVLRHAPAIVKQRLWDREFASGKWNFIDNTAGDCVYGYLEKYAAGGDILDLGCGPGNTANELKATAYREYLGVDISAVALSKARRRTQENGREHKNRFTTGDLLTFTPERQFDIILFRESVYHVSVGRLERLLERYAGYLKPTGLFVVRIRHRQRHTSQARMHIIETAFAIVEEGFHGADGSAVVVFRPKPHGLDPLA